MSDELTAKLQCPRVPNYILLEIPGLVKGGQMEAPKVSVSELSKEQKDWLAAAWREGLDEVAARQKKSPDPVYRGIETTSVDGKI